MEKPSEQELLLLNKIHRTFRTIETHYDQPSFREKELMVLVGLLQSLSLSPVLALQKISEISEHLHPQLQLSQFLNFLVPVERVLNKNLKDSDFLVTSEDHDQTPHPKVPLVLVLDHLRSAFNVGSLFRLADGIGVCEIHLCGYTPEPTNKTALNSEKHTLFLKFKNVDASLTQLKKQGYEICALETTPQSESLFTAQLKKPIALVVGNERFGLDEPTLKKCDRIISIPMFGIKNSLNVTQAVSMFCYEWRKQWSP